jgi:hypothetical protein
VKRIDLDLSQVMVDECEGEFVQSRRREGKWDVGIMRKSVIVPG